MSLARASPSFLPIMICAGVSNIRELLAGRSLCDELLGWLNCRVKEKETPLDHAHDSDGAALSSPESGSLHGFLQRAGSFVVALSEVSIDWGGDSALHWDDVVSKVNSGAVVIQVCTARGMRMRPGEAPAASASDTASATLAVARAIQTEDRLVPNGTAIQLAEVILTDAIRAAGATPAAVLEAANTVLDVRCHSGVARFDGLVLDIPERRVQALQIRVAVQHWGAGRYGLGYQLVLRGRVKVLWKPEEAAPGDPLDELGQLLSTLVTSCPVLVDDCGLEFSDPGLSSEEGDVDYDALNFIHMRWDASAAAPSDNEADEGTSASNQVASGERDDWENVIEAVTDRRGSGDRTSWGTRSAATSTMEAFSWGDNEHGELCNATRSVIPGPTPLSWAKLTPWEQVQMVATSARHTVLATNVGSVYTCGDGTDGALGHNDLQSSRKLRLVTWFADAHPQPDIVSIGAGADLFGSHSLAMDSTGNIYSWGVGSACGRGTRKPLPEPARVEFDEQPAPRFLAVDCGGGYCAAVAVAGTVWTWGNWTGGRLGLGPVPSKVDRSYLHAGTRKRTMPLLLRPKRVRRGLDAAHVVRVACGDAHTVVLTRSGSVYIWGQNESGQLGTGASPSSGRLEAEFWPRLIPRFNGTSATASFVACGAAHTLVIDSVGGVWTWGGFGGSCLGFAAEGEGRRTRQIFRPTSELQAARAVRQRSGEVRMEEPAWSRPRYVEALRGAGAVSAGLGERHTAVVLRSGCVVMCGDGVALMHHTRKQSGARLEEAPSDLEHLQPVAVPRMPNSSWFSALQGKFLTSVCCGGQHTIVLGIGERLGLTLGAAMLEAVTSAEAVSSDLGRRGEGGTAAWNLSDVHAGNYDCLMITAGQALAAHKVVLARRSARLRELISAEERPGTSEPLELLLPELRHDTAMALREYLYTDTISMPLEPGASLPYDLLSAAENLELPRLAALCRNALPVHSLGGVHMPVPPSTLLIDFGGALGESTWADVKFIAGGRAIYAHRAILSASSEYFRSMFRSGMREMEHDNR